MARWIGLLAQFAGIAASDIDFDAEGEDFRGNHLSNHPIVTIVLSVRDLTRES
jgi:hypothetical protein